MLEESSSPPHNSFMDASLPQDNRLNRILSSSTDNGSEQPHHHHQSPSQDESSSNQLQPNNSQTNQTTANISGSCNGLNPNHSIASNMLSTMQFSSTNHNQPSTHHHTDSTPYTISHQHEHGQQHRQSMLNAQSTLDQKPRTITQLYTWPDQSGSNNYTTFSAFGAPSAMASYPPDSLLASGRTLPGLSSVVMSNYPYAASNATPYPYHMQPTHIPLQYSTSNNSGANGTTGTTAQDAIMMMRNTPSAYSASQPYAVPTYTTATSNTQQNLPQMTSQQASSATAQSYYAQPITTASGTPESQPSTAVSPSLSSPSTARTLSAGSSMSRRTSRGAPASKFDTTNFNFATDPQGKPQQSYATIITYALQTAPSGQMTLNDIYEWVMHYYPYFRTAGSGWKNSIRHNLSLNRAFIRVPRPPNEGGKGAYWTLDPDFVVGGGSPIRKPRSVSDPPFGGTRVRSSTDPSASYRETGTDDGGDSGSTASSVPSGRRISGPQFSEHMYSNVQDSETSRMGLPDTAVESGQKGLTQLPLPTDDNNSKYQQPRTNPSSRYIILPHPSNMPAIQQPLQPVASSPAGSFASPMTYPTFGTYTGQYQGSPRTGTSSGNSTVAGSPSSSAGYGSMSYTSGYVSRAGTNPTSPQHRASGLSNVLATADYDDQQRSNPTAVTTSYDMSSIPSISHNLQPIFQPTTSDSQSNSSSQTQPQQQTGTLGLWNTRPSFTSFVNTTSNSGGNGASDETSLSQSSQGG